MSQRAQYPSPKGYFGVAKSLTPSYFVDGGHQKSQHNCTGFRNIFCCFMLL